MNKQAVTQYLLTIAELYRNSLKREKTRILDEAVKVCPLNRKQIIRRLQKGPESIVRGRGSGRRFQYPRGLLKPYIRKLWKRMGYPCALIMHASMEEWLEHLPVDMNFPSAIKRKLLQMSASTVGRFLKEIRGDRNKGKSTTRPASSYLKSKVPINTLGFRPKEPGNLQADTVSHCGTNAGGLYTSTLTTTDVYSSWTENRAILGKRAHKVSQKFYEIQKELPFLIIGINTDSGTEFINNEVVNFMNSNGRRINFTRSRPYCKNDNCFVEQKNFTHVRELMGYDRIEDKAHIDLMNDIYINYWNPLKNFFIPCLKLKEKYREKSRVIKKYHKAQTPFNWLMKSDALSEEYKRRLRKRKKELNPFVLKSEMDKKLDQLFLLLQRSKNGKAA